MWPGGEGGGDAVLTAGTIAAALPVVETDVAWNTVRVPGPLVPQRPCFAAERISRSDLRSIRCARPTLISSSLAAARRVMTGPSMPARISSRSRPSWGSVPRQPRMRRTSERSRRVSAIDLARARRWAAPLVAADRAPAPETVPEPPVRCGPADTGTPAEREPWAAATTVATPGSAGALAVAGTAGRTAWGPGAGAAGVAGRDGSDGAVAGDGTEGADTEGAAPRDAPPPPPPRAPPRAPARAPA